MKRIIFLLPLFALACNTLPTSSEYLARGEGYHKDGKPEMALKQYKKALKINPDNVDVYASRGAAYFYMKNYEAAAKDFTVVINNQPNNVAAYNALGSSLAAMGKNEDALKFVSAAVSANRDSTRLGESVERDAATETTAIDKTPQSISARKARRIRQRRRK